MSEYVQWHRDALGEKLVKALEKNLFTATYVQSREVATAELLEVIPTNATIGFGGSVTLAQLGIIAKLEERGNPVQNYLKPGLSPEEMRAIRRQPEKLHEQMETRACESGPGLQNQRMKTMNPKIKPNEDIKVLLLSANPLR